MGGSRSIWHRLPRPHRALAVLYITSDRPGGGKTVLASALARQLSPEAGAVGYFKPFSPTPNDDHDVAFMGKDVLSGAHEAIQPLPLPISDEKGQPMAEDAARERRQSMESLAAAQSLVLVEGPSLSYSEVDLMPVSVRMTEILDAGVLLLVRYRPGLDIEQILALGKPFGPRLLGVLINAVTRYRERDVRVNLGPTIESNGLKFLGAIPEDRLMLSVTVGQLADHLDGEWVLGQEKAEELVETLLIGGNIMDWGITYFGRTASKAVIVRGDRLDIQLAALSTPTTCLILTGGHQPAEYVYYQAQQEDVPVLVVKTDTMATAQALETVTQRCAVHHLGKLDRFQELIRSHSDIGSIQAAAG